MKNYLIKHTALLHNGKRYEPGERIQLNDTEAENLALYLELDTTAEQTGRGRQHSRRQAENGNGESQGDN